MLSWLPAIPRQGSLNLIMLIVSTADGQLHAGSHAGDIGELSWLGLHAGRLTSMLWESDQDGDCRKWSFVYRLVKTGDMLLSLIERS